MRLFLALLFLPTLLQAQIVNQSLMTSGSVNQTVTGHTIYVGAGAVLTATNGGQIVANSSSVAWSAITGNPFGTVSTFFGQTLAAGANASAIRTLLGVDQPGIVGLLNSGTGAMNLSGYTLSLSAGQIPTLAYISQASGSGTGTTLTNSTLIGGTATGLSLTPIASSLYVDGSNGNDATGTRGQLTLPFLTGTAAYAKASPGDSFILRSGSYNSGLQLSLSTGTTAGINLIGSGQSSTILSTAGITDGLSPGNNSLLRDITITGSSPNQNYPITDFGNKFTGATFINTKVNGISDGLFLNNYADTGEFDFCSFNTQFDAINNNSGSFLVFKSCDANVAQTTESALLRGVVCESGTINYYGGNIAVTGGTGTSLGVYAYGAGTVINILGTKINNAISGATTAYDLWADYGAVINYNAGTVRQDGAALVIHTSNGGAVNNLTNPANVTAGYLAAPATTGSYPGMTVGTANVLATPSGATAVTPNNILPGLVFFSGTNYGYITITGSGGSSNWAFSNNVSLSGTLSSPAFSGTNGVLAFTLLNGTVYGPGNTWNIAPNGNAFFGGSLTAADNTLDDGLGNTIILGRLTLGVSGPYLSHSGTTSTLTGNLIVTGTGLTATNVQLGNVSNTASSGNVVIGNGGFGYAGAGQVTTGTNITNLFLTSSTLLGTQLPALTLNAPYPFQSPVTFTSGTGTLALTNTNAANYLLYWTGTNTLGPLALGTNLSVTTGILNATGGGVTSGSSAITGLSLAVSSTTATLSGTASANNVFAGPTSGSAATPAFRSLVEADLPAPAFTALTDGTSATITSAGRSTDNTLLIGATNTRTLSFSGLASGQSGVLVLSTTYVNATVVFPTNSYAALTTSGTVPTAMPNLVFTGIVTAAWTATSATTSIWTIAQSAGGFIASTNGLGSNTSLTGTTTIVGVTGTGNAATGNIGEFITSSVAIGSGSSMSSGAVSNITSISLTAGDWEVWGVVDFHEGSGTVSTYFEEGTSSTSVTLGPQDSFAADSVAMTTTVDVAKPVPRWRYSIGSTTTVYLVAQAGFSVSTVTGYGTIWARRIR